VIINEQRDTVFPECEIVLDDFRSAISLTRLVDLTGVASFNLATSQTVTSDISRVVTWCYRDLEHTLVRVIFAGSIHMLLGYGCSVYSTRMNRYAYVQELGFHDRVYGLNLDTKEFTTLEVESIAQLHMDEVEPIVEYHDNAYRLGMITVSGYHNFFIKIPNSNLAVLVKDSFDSLSSNDVTI
jgi:hypothetical protein